MVKLSSRVAMLERTTAQQTSANIAKKKIKWRFDKEPSLTCQISNDLPCLRSLVLRRDSGPLFGNDLPARLAPDVDVDVPDPPLRELPASPPIYADPDPGNDGRVAVDTHAHLLAT